MTLLQVKNLSVRFENGEHIVDAVKGISFDVEKGEMVALVGESGSGKSVTAQSIMQLLNRRASYPSGSIHFDGEKITPTLARTLRGKRISMIFQEPMSALNPLHTIGKQIEEMLTTHQRLSKTDQQTRMMELLDMVGLQKFKTRLNTYPHQLSGGERQRVMIAMAMANNPDILIADEPTTALDVTLQTQILDLLKELQESHNMAILLITHDLTIVKRLSDRVVIMQAGKIVEQGDTKTIFKAPKEAYTKSLLNSAPSGSALPLKKDAKTILSCDNLKVYFPIKGGLLGRTRDYVKAVDGIDLNVKTGETIGIVGESGSGKTTLGLALLRLIKSDGPITYLSDRIDQMNGRAIRHMRSDLQIVFQDPFASLNPRMTIGQIIGEGLKVHQPNLSRDDRLERTHKILEQVELDTDMINRYPHEFSGGQRQRINIARAMILKPKLVVLDEPTSALDLTIQSQVIDLLKKFQKEQQISYLFISHDLRVVKAISHRVIVLKGGKIIEKNDAEKLFNNPQHDYTKALMKAAFED